MRADDLGDVLNATEDDAADLLAFVLHRLRSSKPRVASVSTLLDAFDDIERDDVLGLELGSPVTIEFTPPGVDRLTLAATVQSIQHDASPESGWRMTVGFAPRPAYFILGDATYGLLDLNALAY